ncbi:SDR family NAD(P)-dependent oxidoreductase [Lachnoclostridium sp.]|uniref:SDR family NAD(P)-dependent oxidoreductase n=1 Tax=Lachnoclostridium sp. TaxID=2028282 RepID=UPI00289E297D|nr:SDR family NAD(P)-dependent oxidoreductase [Lachnoclostridium sp.]
MKEGNVIITGANSGIGKAAAIKFAKEGFKVIMACRNLEKSRVIKQEIMEISKNNSIELLPLDVSSFQSIKDFCREIQANYNRLDVIIHNAGYFKHGEKDYQLSKDNIELSFATNVFGPFLMTKLLSNLLRNSEDGRVLTACSTNIRHFFDPKRKIDYDSLQGELKDGISYNSYKMYGDSKMALLLMTFELAEYYKNDGIKINAVQIPAIKMSKETIKNFKSFWKVAALIQNAFSSTTEYMADTYYHICTSHDYQDATGKLIDDKGQIMQASHYTKGITQEIKQLSDKRVYPSYAANQENMKRMLELANRLTKPWLPA